MLRPRFAKQRGTGFFYTHLSNAERGLPHQPLKKLGAQKTDKVRRGEVVADNEANTARIRANEHLADELALRPQSAALEPVLSPAPKPDHASNTPSTISPEPEARDQAAFLERWPFAKLRPAPMLPQHGEQTPEKLSLMAQHGWLPSPTLRQDANLLSALTRHQAKLNRPSLVIPAKRHPPMANVSFGFPPLLVPEAAYCFPPRLEDGLSIAPQSELSSFKISKSRPSFVSQPPSISSGIGKEPPLSALPSFLAIGMRAKPDMQAGTQVLRGSPKEPPIAVPSYRAPFMAVLFSAPPILMPEPKYLFPPVEVPVYRAPSLAAPATAPLLLVLELEQLFPATGVPEQRNPLSTGVAAPVRSVPNRGKALQHLFPPNKLPSRLEPPVIDNSSSQLTKPLLDQDFGAPALLGRPAASERHGGWASGDLTVASEPDWLPLPARVFTPTATFINTKPVIPPLLGSQALRAARAEFFAATHRYAEAGEELAFGRPISIEGLGLQEHVERRRLGVPNDDTAVATAMATHLIKLYLMHADQDEVGFEQRKRERRARRIARSDRQRSQAATPSISAPPTPVSATQRMFAESQELMRTSYAEWLRVTSRRLKPFFDEKPVLVEWWRRLLASDRAQCAALAQPLMNDRELLARIVVVDPLVVVMLKRTGEALVGSGDLQRDKLEAQIVEAPPPSPTARRSALRPDSTVATNPVGCVREAGSPTSLGSIEAEDIAWAPAAHGLLNNWYAVRKCGDETNAQKLAAQIDGDAAARRSLRQLHDAWHRLILADAATYRDRARKKGRTVHSVTRPSRGQDI